MTTISELIRQIRMEPGCSVAPPGGVPEARPGHLIPDDVLEFYRAAGGASFFSDKDYAFHVLPPDQVRRANPVLVPGYEETGDISDAWYLIVGDGQGEYLTVDCHPTRLGRCYVSFHETHGLVGDTPIIAASFTELLGRLLDNRGEYPYWLRDDFERMGDAYDDETPGTA